MGECSHFAASDLELMVLVEHVFLLPSALNSVFSSIFLLFLYSLVNPWGSDQYGVRSSVLPFCVTCQPCCREGLRQAVTTEFLITLYFLY